MSDIIKAILLGIVEGLTEFIPVSSTGHLIIMGNLLDFVSANPETFSIAIQLGAILAVVFLYRRFFIKTFLQTRWFSKDFNNIILAIIPAFILGFLLHSFIKKHLFNPFTVAIGLLLGAIVMLIVDFFRRKKPAVITEISHITYKQAVFIGIIQCFALWPGISRSGATIVGGLISGVSYRISAQFSFIIAVPVMFAAVGYDLLKTASNLNLNDVKLISIGFVVSFIVAIFSITIFMRVLRKLKLAPFAIYRIILAGVILFSFLK